MNKKRKRKRKSMLFTRILIFQMSNANASKKRYSTPSFQKKMIILMLIQRIFQRRTIIFIFI